MAAPQMTHAQFTAALAHLGLTKSAYSRLFGTQYRTITRWASGEHRVPVEMAVLLHLLVHDKITMRDIEEAVKKL